MLKPIKIVKSIINDLIDVTEKYDIILNNISDLNIEDVIDYINISNKLIDEHNTLSILCILVRERVLEMRYRLEFLKDNQFFSYVDANEAFKTMDAVCEKYPELYDIYGYDIFKKLSIYFYKINEIERI